MSEPTFSLGADGKSIKCHKCGMTSYNLHDVAFHYCGKCNLWHDGPNLLNADSEAAFFKLAEAIGRLLARTMPNAKFFLTTHQNPAGGVKGVSKFGVSVVTNLTREETVKLLTGILAKAKEPDLPTVTAFAE